MQTLTNNKVRRCLFGPPDHEAVKKDLAEALAQDNEVFNSKYNFDFDNDSPLEGNYKWEVVDDKQYIPDFYKRGYPVKVKRRITDLNSVKQTSGCISALSFDNVDTESCQKKDSVENCDSSSQFSQNTLCNKPSLKQTQISAFMPKRKRSRTDAASTTVRSKAPRL